MNRLLILGWIIMVFPIKTKVRISWLNYTQDISVYTYASNKVYTTNWDHGPEGDITRTKRDADENNFCEAVLNSTYDARHEVATWVDVDGAGNVFVSCRIWSGSSNPVNVNSLPM